MKNVDENARYLVMRRFEDYPYSPFREALGSVVGRLILVVLAVLLGAWLAGWSATRSLSSSPAGILGLPGWMLGSTLTGAGLIAIPATLLFAFAFVRLEWPLWTCLACAVLMWWNLHGTMRWTLYDSPAAKMQQKLNDVMQQTTEEMTGSGWKTRKTKDGVSFSKTLGPAHPGPTRSRNH